MPVTPHATRDRLALGFEEVLSDDGTRLRTWTNDPDGSIEGPTVLLCNGLGTNAWAWPALLDPGCGVRVVSWLHRGVGGSARPDDIDRVGIEEFAEDAVSVMDHYEVESAVVMGWSMGVNTAFELAARHPERVRGIFAVGGVPGDTFSTMLGPLHLPHWVVKQTTVGLSRVLKVAGPVLTPITQRLPIGARAVRTAGYSGLIGRVVDPELAALSAREMLTTPVGWYFHLALRTSQHARVSLSALDLPAFFVAGSRDLLAGARDMRSASARMSEATYVELSGTHFIQMEQPEVVHSLLREFLGRVG